MESPYAEAAEMGPPSEAEIAARFERATRSVLASSSLASYSYSQSSTREQFSSQIPALADLLTHVGAPDCQRCPSCRAPLPFGPRSRLCLACDATLIEIPTPSLTSSLAFRRFSEALGLETDLGVVEEEHFPDQEADIVIKPSASSLSAPIEAGVLHVGTSLDKPTFSKEATAANALPHTGSSSDINIVFSTPPSSSILDYSAKLEGISLDDFFSNHVKQESTMPPTNNVILVDMSGAVLPVDTPGIKVRKDSLFWDPLSETIIPDGFDLLASTSESNTSKDIPLDKVMGVDEDDDPFSSWEGDFQSAPPAVTNTSTSHTFAQPGDIEDFFGNFVNPKEVKGRSGGESVEGKNSWANDIHIFGSATDTTGGRNVDVDDLLFGSEWQQSVQPSGTLATNGSQATSFFDGEDMFGPFSSPLTEMPGVNDNSHDYAREGSSTPAEDQPLTEPQASQSAGRKNKIVGSLLARLHDLSFMLADKLVIKTEGKGTEPESSS